MPGVDHLWFFLLSHLLRNYLTDSNETCLLCSPQCLVVQVQKRILVRRQIWSFGSRLGLSGFSHWQACYRISSKTTGRMFFKSWSECSPQCLVVQVPKKIRSVEKHGRRQPSLIFLVIASPQKLLGGFEWNLPVRLASVSSCASTKPNSHLWQIRLTFTFERICHTCEEFARICHTCEKFERILHRCDKYVRILLTSKIRHLWKTRTY